MIERGTRFGIPFEIAFAKGLLQTGDVVADTEYQPDRNRPSVQKIDPVTGKRQWKVTVTDPDQTNAKRASFELIFLADVQPVPSAPELAPGTGLRMIELDGLSVEPRVMGQGEFKYQGFAFRADGYREPASRPASGGRSETAKAA